MHLHFPSPLSPAVFLQQYWQKKPLLMRDAIQNPDFFLGPEELAGLACEDEIESRLVTQNDQNQWALQHGPFNEETFAQLPDKNWTILVQDVDKYFPEIARLLGEFHFIPSWRFDDIMISYAVPGGSVGPHIDTYDVFLIQARGCREWQIDTRVNHQALLPDLPVRILAEFDAEHRWLLKPGDILYLPPGVAHWGIAQDDCMTWSVGLRAPSQQEMLDSFAQYLLERMPATTHYQDPPLQPQHSPAQIGSEVFQQVGKQFNAWLCDEELQKRWFGCFCTELKPHLQIEAPTCEWNEEKLRRILRQDTQLSRHPFARLAWSQSATRAYLFACGNDYPLPLEAVDFLPLLCDAEKIAAKNLRPWLDRPYCLNLLLQLFNNGYLELSHD